MFDALFPSHWSDIQKLMWLKILNGGTASYETIVGNPVSFSAVAAPLRQLKVAFSPVQTGTGDPSPDNVRPISGWSSFRVYDDPLYAGVIEWNQLIAIPASDISDSLNGITFTDNRDGSFSVSGTASADTVFNFTDAPVAAYTGHKYAVVGTPSSGSASTYWWQTANAILDTGNGTIYDRTSYATNSWYGSIRVKSGTTIETPVVFRPQYCDLTEMFGAGNEPATVEEFKALFPHDYYAYNAGTETLVGTVNGLDTRSISISLGQTVYSGWVDVVTGIGEITGVAKMASTMTWTDNGIYANTFNGAGFTNRKTRIDANEDCFCDTYKWYTSDVVGVQASGIALAITSGSSGTRIYIKDSRFANASEFTASLADNDVMIVCPLQTTIPISLTPQQINSLAGANTMWSNANGDLTVEYRSN